MPQSMDDEPRANWGSGMSPQSPVEAAPETALDGDRLRDVKALTETSLPFHDVDQLLTVLLGKVLNLMRVDTCAVLLLDSAAKELVARAARGLEEEVRQGVRVPVGAGFAGRIAAERRPVAIDEVDSSTVTNPILWEKGIHSMLGVPLIAAGKLIGVIHVGSFARRTFSGDDVILLELAAEKVATAIQAGTVEAERIATDLLQRSLLPSALPNHPQIEFASRYAPAQRGGVGGDWYDAFELPSGQVWVMTGDVVGHGLQAAIVMGRLRSALRSYALLGMTPEDVLQGANRKLRLFEPNAMATVVCVALSPPFDELRVVTAGHPPPVLARPGEEPIILDTPAAPPLGVVEDLAAYSTKWKLVDQTVLVLYTDGLIERRGESLAWGLERLRSVVRNSPPHRLCATVMDTLIGSYLPGDDVALLALRISPISSGRRAGDESGSSVVVRSELFSPVVDSVALARHFISECVEQVGLRALPDVQLMVSELATNAILHAVSHFDITVEKLEENRARVEVRDFGDGSPQVEAPGLYSEEGRGLQVVNRLANEWGVEEHPGGRGKSIWFIVTV
jgi:anti-sigma regulatory factor (Ser/Thr protein kinase)/putative methionine-R-sulfoxide reductase with GAF domain